MSSHLLAVTGQAKGQGRVVPCPSSRSSRSIDDGRVSSLVTERGGALAARSHARSRHDMQQRASIGEVIPPTKAQRINRKLREKRRLTQFNFEVPFVDFHEVVKTLSSATATGQRQSCGGSSGADATNTNANSMDKASSGAEAGGGEDEIRATAAQDAMEEDDEEGSYDYEEDEIGAEDIILKWVV